MPSPTKKAAERIEKLIEVCEEAPVGEWLAVEPVDDGLLPVVVFARALPQRPLPPSLEVG